MVTVFTSTRSGEQISYSQSTALIQYLAAVRSLQADLLLVILHVALFSYHVPLYLAVIHNSLL